MDAGAALEALRRNAGERRAPNPVALPLPDLARRAEHRALAAAGDADHHGKVARARHMQIGQHLLRAELLVLAIDDAFPPLVVHPMRGALVQRGRRRDQPPLDRDHFPRREPLPAAPVLADAHQLGRRFDLRHDRGELRGAVAMPVHQPRQVLPG